MKAAKWVLVGLVSLLVAGGCGPLSLFRRRSMQVVRRGLRRRLYPGRRRQPVGGLRLNETPPACPSCGPVRPGLYWRVDNGEAVVAALAGESITSDL